MNDRKTFLSNFSAFNLIVIAFTASIGIATKPIIVPLVHIITGPLFIPGGAIAGGFYMMWIVLGIGIVRKMGTGTLIGLIQAIVVVATGFMGAHGIMSLVSYTVPGVAADIIFLFSKNKKYNILHYMFGCMAANMSGTLITNIMFFRLPTVTVIFIISSAALSGAIGGIIAYSIIKAVEKININI